MERIRNDYDAYGPQTAVDQSPNGNDTGLAFLLHFDLDPANPPGNEIVQPGADYPDNKSQGGIDNRHEYRQRKTDHCDKCRRRTVRRFRRETSYDGK